MIKILLLAVVPFMTQHRNVVPKTEISTNFYGSVTGIVDKAYIEARIGAGGGGMDTNAVDALANSAVVTNALTVAITNRVALLETSKADKSTLAAHVANTDNPHEVTAAQVGAVPLVEDVSFEMTAVTIGSRNPDVDVGPDSLANGDGVVASGNYSHAEGSATTAAGNYSHAEGSVTTAAGDYSHAEGVYSQTRSGDTYAFAWNGDGERVERYDPYESHGPGTFNINPAGGLNGFYIGEQTFAGILALKADKSVISATDPTFSNAVLAVGLNIDTNSVAVLNDIAATFGGFPLGAGETATTVGGLLAALAAAIAWLKKNKVGSFASVGDATATVENGVAKLDDFFTESNSLLTGTIAAKSIPAFSSSSTYEVGEIVIYDGVAYKCVTAITTVEEWTAAHWTLATNSDLAARLKGLRSDGTATDAFATSLLGKQVAKEAIDEEIIEKGTAPDAHLEAPTDEHLKLILADNSVAYDSAKALPYKLTSVIGDRVIATMTLTAASTDITLPTISANDTTVKDFILDVTNAYAVEGVATDAGINIPRTDFKLVTRDGESLTDVTTVKAGKSAFLCFTQKAPVVVDGTTYPCWCVIQLPFGDPS